MGDRILSFSAPIWTSRPRFVFLVVKFPSQGAISFMKALFLLGSKFCFIVLNKACGSHWMHMDGYYLLPLKLHLCLLDEDYPVLWILSSANKWSKQPCGAVVQAPQTLASKWITLIDKWILNLSLWQHWTDSERGNCWMPHAPLVHSNATRGWKTPTWGTVGIPLTLWSLSYLFNHTVFTYVKLCKNSTELLHFQKE